MTKWFRSVWVGVLFFFLLAGGSSFSMDGTAWAEDASAPAAELAAEPTVISGVQSKKASLQDIIQSMENLQSALSSKKNELKTAETDEKKRMITEEMNRLIRILEARQNEFEALAVGIDLEGDLDRPITKIDLKEEIQDIFRPFIEQVKELTSHPREIEKLRKEIEFYNAHLKAVVQGLANIQALMADTKDPKLKKRLVEIEREWIEREKETRRQADKAKEQLEKRIESKQSIVKIFQTVGDDFFKTRGINLILAILAFLGVFFIFRFLYWWGSRSRRLSAVRSRSFYSRLFEVLYHFFTFFMAISASLLLLYNFGDWMLLSIAMIFLVGVAWTTKNGFAMFWEQAKFLLNIGTVRDGERLIYDGVPWQVTSLNLITTLKNPVLQGGIRRLPLQSLIGLQSRPFGENELWFPTRKGDYVVLADGAFGQVVRQTPEMVSLEVLGGCVKTYPCTAFMDQNPINLSMNSFGVATTFGIDYAHQANVTHEIPRILHETVQKEIVKEAYGEYLLDILVQFKEAGASSLDMLIWVKFEGKAAEYYYMIGRTLQTIAVDACNTHGWGIPFTQITVHQADEGTP